MEVREGYKQTELGIIPENWDVKRLKFVCSMKSGNTITSESISEFEKYPCYGGNGLRGFTKSHTHSGAYTLIGRQGALCGNITFVDGVFFASEHAIVTTPNSQTNIKWLSYVLFKMNLNQYTESTAQPGLSVQKILELPIVIPPTKSEQTAIATALSDADALITSLEKLIAKKRLIKQGAMQELLSPTGSNGKPKEGWVVKKLGDFLEYEQPTKYIVTDTEYKDNNQTPVLTAGKTFILGYTDEEFGIFTDTPVIIFDDFTTATKYVDFSFKVKSSAMKLLKPKFEEVNLRFVYEIMQRIIYPMGIGDHKRHWIGEYQFIEIKVPPYEEQTRIAAILSDMDAEITTLEAKLEKYRKIKLGMMQELLTGRIRLIVNG